MVITGYIIDNGYPLEIPGAAFENCHLWWFYNDLPFIAGGWTDRFNGKPWLIMATSDW